MIPIFPGICELYTTPRCHSIHIPSTLLPPPLVLRLEQQRLKLITRVLLDPKYPVNPFHNNAKARRLTHMSRFGHESRLLGGTVLQSQVVVVDGEDLVLCTVDEEETGAVG